METSRLRVRFGNGLPVNWAVPGREGFLDFADDQVRIADLSVAVQVPISVGESRSNGLWSKQQFGCKLSDVKFISYENAGTKSDVASIAVFGVLGLGARKQWTLVTVGFPESDAQFLVRGSFQEMRGFLQGASGSNPTLSSLLTEGPPPNLGPKVNTPPASSVPSPLDELERLASLYRGGLLSDEEFSVMKAKLIGDG